MGLFRAERGREMSGSEPKATATPKELLVHISETW